VGVNDFVEEGEEIAIPILEVSPEVEKKQRKRIAELRNSRNQMGVDESLAALKLGAADGKNLMPLLLDCTRAYVTLGEMCDSLKEEFGIHEEEAVF
jgi:methylmalonyl-CoA mutase N-terminal domain/subunit